MLKKFALLGGLGMLALTSCEEEYTPESFFTEPQPVVEGYISHTDSGQALPPYVILTKSSPYLATLNTQALNNLFIHNAQIYVTDGIDTAYLTEICLSDLGSIDPALRDAVANSIGLGGASSDSLNFCIYTDAAAFLGTPQLTARVGATYQLHIQYDTTTITAQTTIPPYIALDSLRWIPHPRPEADSLVQVLGYITDPANEANYYRAFSQRNQEPMYPASALGTGTSVTDDAIFNGQTFEFALQRGQSPTSEFDINTFGYFWRGDTVIIRGSTLDRAHFRFWQTLEFNIGSQGPFSSYTRIESNIQGGLGVWGGFAYRDYPLVIPR